jgi:hypothetical protein
LEFFHLFHIFFNNEKILKIWKKSRFNSEKIWKIWKKDKLNSKNDLENMEEK